MPEPTLPRLDLQQESNSILSPIPISSSPFQSNPPEVATMEAAVMTGSMQAVMMNESMQATVIATRSSHRGM
jgi:hypothetical protein